MPLTSEERFKAIFGSHKPFRGTSFREKIPPRRAHHLAAPSIRTDSMEPIRSMGDGQIYDSKSGYYEHLKRGGFEVVDAKPSAPVIEDRPAITTRDVKDAFEKSVAELNNGGPSAVA